MTPAGVGYGLATAASWGSADFLGGSVSRRTTPLATVAPSQAVALAIVTAVLLVVREPAPPLAALLWAALAGCGAFIALACLYRAITTGAMGLVASISALVGAGLPVVVGAAGRRRRGRGAGGPSASARDPGRERPYDRRAGERGGAHGTHRDRH